MLMLWRNVRAWSKALRQGRRESGLNNETERQSCMIFGLAGYAYIGLAGVALLFQIALALGAPWGALALGGRWQGRLPLMIRGFALVQAAVIAGMALVVAARTGITDIPAGPRWLFWPVLMLTAVSAVANLTTPSPPERLVWGPVTAAMLLAAAITAFA